MSRIDTHTAINPLSPPPFKTFLNSGFWSAMVRNSGAFLVWFALSLLGSAHPVQAAALQLEAANEHPSLKGHLSWLLDGTGQMSFHQAAEQRQSGRFIPVEGDEVAPGFLPHGAIWIHFVLARDAVAPTLWWLAFPAATLDHIDLYLEQPDGAYEVRHGGRAAPFAQHENPWRAHSFKLSLDTVGPRNVYVRVATIATFRVPVWLWQDKAFGRFQAKESFFLGAYFGIISAAFLFSLYRTLYYRSIIDFFYALYIAGLELVTFIAYGYFQQFGLSDSLPFRIGLSASGLMMAGLALPWFYSVPDRLARSNQAASKTGRCFRHGALYPDCGGDGHDGADRNSPVDEHRFDLARGDGVCSQPVGGQARSNHSAPSLRTLHSA